jgi:hypothetical protein
MEEKTPSRQIDDIIKKTDDWRGEMLSQLRDAVIGADPHIVEEVKWKKPSRPEGVAVWSQSGNLCMADILKHVVRLTFPKGAQLCDPDKLFNARLDSTMVRAIDFYENNNLRTPALQALIREAIAVNKR